MILRLFLASFLFLVSCYIFQKGYSLANYLNYLLLMLHLDSHSDLVLCMEVKMLTLCTFFYFYDKNILLNHVNCYKTFLSKKTKQYSFLSYNVPLSIFDVLILLQWHPCYWYLLFINFGVHLLPSPEHWI
jgi:hypothetical protein